MANIFLRWKLLDLRCGFVSLHVVFESMIELQNTYDMNHLLKTLRGLNQSD
jgi:hypothetical protein